MEWIDVNDRLPEMEKSEFGDWFVSDDVLVTNGEEVFISFAETNSDGSVSFELHRHKHIPVTHWMPLPKPPVDKPAE